MAKDTLVTENLSDSMIETGKLLIERLDKCNAEVKSAFWFYSSDDKIWKLIIASPLVASNGPREYYKKVIEANSTAKDDEKVISLNDIAVTDISNQIVQLVKITINTGDGISGIRFSKNTINGVFLEDMYIYRSNI